MPSRVITNGKALEWMRRAGEEQMRYLKRAAELGATIVHDSVTFPGTVEEQQAKIRELFSSLNLPVPKDLI